jgi:hypothetical protein
MLYRATRSRGVRGGGAGEFQGENRAYGVPITFSVNAPGLPLANEERERERKEAERVAARRKLQPAVDRPGSTPRQEDPPPSDKPAADEAQDRRGGDKGPQAEIRIADASGKVIRTIKQPVKLGLNRVVWDFGRDAFRNPEGQNRGGFRPGGESGPNVMPGTYGVTVKFGEREAKGTLKVEADPDVKSSQADWQAWDAATARMGELQNAVTDAVNRIAATRKDVGVVLGKLDAQAAERERSGASNADTGKGTEDPNKALRQAARDLQKKLSAVEKTLYTPPDTKGIVDEEDRALNKVQNAGRALGSAWGTPSATTRAYVEEAEATVREALAGFNKLYAEDVAAFRQKVADAKIDLLGPVTPIEVK